MARLARCRSGSSRDRTSGQPRRVRPGDERHRCIGACSPGRPRPSPDWKGGVGATISNCSRAGGRDAARAPRARDGALSAPVYRELVMFHLIPARSPSPRPARDGSTPVIPSTRSEACHDRLAARGLPQARKSGRTSQSGTRSPWRASRPRRRRASRLIQDKHVPSFPLDVRGVVHTLPCPRRTRKEPPPWRTTPQEPTSTCSPAARASPSRTRRPWHQPQRCRGGRRTTGASPTREEARAKVR